MLTKKMKKEQSHGNREKKSRNQLRQQQQKRNILFVGDSMPTGISGKGSSKKHNVSMTGFSGGTSKNTIQNTDDLLKTKPDVIVTHAGTNDITNGVNLLNSVNSKTSFRHFSNNNRRLFIDNGKKRWEIYRETSDR